MVETDDAGGSYDDQLQKAIQASISDQNMAPSGGAAGGVDSSDAQMQQVLLDSMQTAGKVATQEMYEVAMSPVELIRTDPNLPVGLRNIGNTCYGNTFLQLFYSIPGFRELVYSYHQSSQPDAEPNPFFEALQLTFTRMQHSSTKVIDPRIVLTAMKDTSGNTYKIGDQEDVAEFNDRFLNSIEGAICNNPELKNALKKIIEGTMQETYTAVGMDTSRVVEDTVRSVVLPVAPESRSLLDLLDNLTTPEDIENFKFEVKNEAGLISEHVAEKATKNVWFSNYPKLLNFQLQRVSFVDGAVKKNNQSVLFPYKLNMARYLQQNSSESLQTRAKVSNIKKDQQNLQQEINNKTNVSGTSRSLTELLEVISSKLPNGMSGGDLPTEFPVEKVIEGFKIWGARDAEQLNKLRTNENNLSDKIDSAFDHLSSGDNDTDYELWGILMHDGNLADSGHYWAALRSAEKDCWFKYNDQSVSLLTPEEVDIYRGSTLDPTFHCSAYCAVYIRSDIARYSNGGNASAPPDLIAKVQSENSDHQQKVDQWNADMSRIPDLITKYQTELQNSTACTMDARCPVLDPRISSKIVFAYQKYKSTDVLKVLPVVEAYRECFGADLIQDWQSKEQAPRADEVARSADISNLLYSTKGQISSIRSAHDSFIKASVRYYALLSSMISPDIDYNEAQQYLWEYIKERDRLDNCWKDVPRFAVVFVEFLVRWVTSLAKQAKTSFSVESILNPVGIMGRLCFELPSGLGAHFKDYLVDTISKACPPLLSSMVRGTAGISDAFNEGKSPPQFKGLSLLESSATNLSEDIMQLESHLSINLSPATTELIAKVTL
eukprot:TRINITY_DN5606_c2_g1_i1.p1 TRINITY_DN5606_c2_g1~~TRINITY_DN5606_c2_g1_i1.p1  ORF type:complete len:831 (+),score=173.26 TRINITY_DN5606_c2_g1_i1:62-2554(+)